MRRLDTAKSRAVEAAPRPAEVHFARAIGIAKDYTIAFVAERQHALATGIIFSRVIDQRVTLYAGDACNAA
ncbi:MAG: hypothetical protein WDM89_04280 [Rhizomicrobium sp.]